MNYKAIPTDEDEVEPAQEFWTSLKEDPTEGSSFRSTGRRLFLCSRYFIQISFVFLILGALLAFRSALQSNGLQGSHSNNDDDDSIIISFTNAYPPINTAAAYGYEHVVEPGTATTISMGITYIPLNYQCEWTITEQQWSLSSSSLASSTSDGVFIQSGCNDFEHIFDSVSSKYAVTVRWWYTGFEVPSIHEISTEVICKYVRREIRSLSTSDRDRYFAALEIVHRMSLDEGIALYGDKFKNYEYFTAKHLNAQSMNDCFPYVGPFHGSNAFLTSHAAFTLELEQSLQSIDSAITQPYWDFTLDAKLSAEEANHPGWQHSEIFGYEYFGLATPNLEGDHVLDTNISRWFGYLPIASTVDEYGVSSAATSGLQDDNGYVVFNAYGRLTNVVNEDSTPYVTRQHSSICGLPTTASLPDAAAIESCDTQFSDSITAWRTCLENTVHAYVHTQIGGSWDCQFSLEAFLEGSPTVAALNVKESLPSNVGIRRAGALEAEASKSLNFMEDDDSEDDSDDEGIPSQLTNPNDPLAKSRTEFLALNAINLWKIAQAQGLVQCPTACSNDTPFTECRCQCVDLKRFASASASSFWDSTFVSQSASSRATRKNRGKKSKNIRAARYDTRKQAERKSNLNETTVESDLATDIFEARRKEAMTESIDTVGFGTGTSFSEELSAAEVYQVLEGAAIFEFLQNPAEAAEFLTWWEDEEKEGWNDEEGEEPVGEDDKDGSFTFRFTGLDERDNDAMMRALLDLTCNPGKVGVMATDASPNDPIFWPLHLLYERSWHRGRLANSLINDWTEDDESNVCYGSRISDIMPFFFSTTTEDDGRDKTQTDMSNKELYDFFDPTNDDLPFLYDSFEFK